MKRLRVVAASIAVLSLTTSAIADVALPRAWYLEANYGRSMVRYPSSTAWNGNGYGWSANIGYKFMPFLGIEAGYTKYAPLSIYGSTQVTHQNYDGHIAAKLMLPFGASGLEAFGKVGAGRLFSYETPISNGGAQRLKIGSTGWYCGGGLEYAGSPNWLINAQWERLQGNDNTTSGKFNGSSQLYTAGISFLLDPAIL